jgi:hypothetical protein
MKLPLPALLSLVLLGALLSTAAHAQDAVTTLASAAQSPAVAVQDGNVLPTHIQAVRPDGAPVMCRVVVGKLAGQGNEQGADVACYDALGVAANQPYTQQTVRLADRERGILNALPLASGGRLWLLVLTTRPNSTDVNRKEQRFVQLDIPLLPSTLYRTQLPAVVAP